MCTAAVQRENLSVMEESAPKMASSVLQLPNYHTVQRIDAETFGISTLHTSNLISLFYAEHGLVDSVGLLLRNNDNGFAYWVPGPVLSGLHV